MSLEYLNLVFSRPEPRGAGLRLVLLTLADMANSEGICWPSVRYIAGRAGISERSVQNAIRALQRRGWITVRLGGRSAEFGTKRASVYTVTKGVTPAPSRVQNPTAEGAKLAPSRVQKMSEEGADFAPQPSENQNTEPPKNQPRKARGRVSYLPSEQSELIFERMFMINGLKNRLGSMPWSREEFEAFHAAGLAAVSIEDFTSQWVPLRDYYQEPAGFLAEYWNVEHGKDFRRRDLLSLLNNWAGEVDRARTWQEWNAKKVERDRQSRSTMDALSFN